MPAAEYDLNGRVALIMGGSRGIGEAIVRRLVDLGAKVAFTYHTSHLEAEALEAEIKGLEKPIKRYHCDIRFREAVHETLAAVVQDFGKLDILVNNAGVNRRKFFEETTDEDWDFVVDTNLKGAFICSQEALPYLKKSPCGRIINISSIASQMAGPKTLHYAVAKSGMDTMTKFLGRYCGPWNITVNSVNPNVILTDMTQDEVNSPQGQQVISETPLNRLGTIDDVTAAVAFLASDDAAYITGHLLNVNGGRYLG
jgi:3-oxoacyl-[acyl-carrier protein] reductase